MLLCANILFFPHGALWVMAPWCTLWVVSSRVVVTTQAQSEWPVRIKPCLLPVFLYIIVAFFLFSTDVHCQHSASMCPCVHTKHPHMPGAHCVHFGNLWAPLHIAVFITGSCTLLFLMYYYLDLNVHVCASLRAPLSTEWSRILCLVKGGVPCAVHALCEKLAVLHHREFGKFRRLKGRH